MFFLLNTKIIVFLLRYKRCFYKFQLDMLTLVNKQSLIKIARFNLLLRYFYFQIIYLINARIHTLKFNRTGYV